MKKGILVITELFLPTKGGTAIWFDEVYRRLGGKEIHIVTAAVGGQEAIDANHPNSIERVDLRRVWWLRPESLGMYIKLFFRAFRICLTQKIDVIHAGRVLPEGMVALAIAKIFRREVVVYAHGEEITTWRQPGKFRAMRFTYRHVDKVVANSDFTYAKLLDLGVNKDCIVQIFPGVDVARFKPDLPFSDLYQKIGMKRDQHLILSVGRLSRRKGFDQVIKALPMLLQRGLDIQYTLIGIGEDADYLVSLAEANGVADRVHFPGHVDALELPRWYNACSIFAMPNREIQGDTEGFGMVFLEAAACGKASVAGMAGGTASAVDDGLTGLRVDGESLEAVVRALEMLLRDDQMASQLGSQALERVRAQFSWAAVAERTATDICQGNSGK